LRKATSKPLLGVSNGEKTEENKGKNVRAWEKRGGVLFTEWRLRVGMRSKDGCDPWPTRLTILLNGSLLYAICRTRKTALLEVV